MMHKILSLLFVVSLLVNLAACTAQPPLTQPGSSGVPFATTGPKPTAPETTTPPPSVPETTVPIQPVLAPNFSQMPEMYADFAQVHISDTVGIFAFMTAGMNDALTTVISYDLAEDALLGRLELGEDTVSIFPKEGGAFAVLSHTTNTYREFDSNCQPQKEISLSLLESQIGIAGLNGNILLASQLMTGTIVLYDLEAGTSLTASVPSTVYQYIGTAIDGFLLESYADGLIYLGFDGVPQILYKKGSAQVAGITYAAGIRGDYVTFLPLQSGDPLMAPCQSMGEIFVDSDGVGLLSKTQNWDAPDSLFYYRTDSMTVAAIPTAGQVIGAGLRNDTAVAVIRTDYSQPLQYQYAVLSDYAQISIGKTAYDNGILNGVEPLPEPTGSEETIALIQRLQQTYGVRIAYEPELFDLEPYGYWLEYAEEADACAHALILEQFFAFLPDGLLREMSEATPLVIFLCQEVQPTAGGLHAYLDGYSVVFLSITGNADYFLSVAAHEMGHALELGVSGEVIQGWSALMPPEAESAYRNPYLTVEYTPDDKGRTPVWYLEAYSRTSEKEDRAVLFSALFDAWRTGNYSALNYDGLKQKAAYWAEMLRLSYDSCKNVRFPWEEAWNL